MGDGIVVTGLTCRNRRCSVSGYWLGMRRCGAREKQVNFSMDCCGHNMEYMAACAVDLVPIRTFLDKTRRRVDKMVYNTL